jgi:hypothetical protein
MQTKTVMKTNQIGRRMQSSSQLKTLYEFASLDTAKIKFSKIGNFSNGALVFLSDAAECRFVVSGGCVANHCYLTQTG